jgi:hypothetical protein
MTGLHTLQLAAGHLHCVQSPNTNQPPWELQAAYGEPESPGRHVVVHLTVPSAGSGQLNGLLPDIAGGWVLQPASSVSRCHGVL